MMTMEIVTLVVLAVITIAMVATIGLEGLWSATVMYFNILIAGIVSMSLFEPLADAAEGVYPYGTMFWDFLCLMGVFAVAVVCMRLTTDFISKRRVRFPVLVDKIGGIVMALMAAGLLNSILLFATFVAPIPPEFGLTNAKADSVTFEETAFLNSAQRWEVLCRLMSQGSLFPILAEPNHTFDQYGNMLPRYIKRRFFYQTQESIDNGTCGVQEKPF